jgi:prepilin-type processing-associated H-X9-DG protein
MLDQGIGMANDLLTVNLEKDLFQALGSEWAVYLDPTIAGNGPLGVTVVNRLARPEGMEQTLGKVQLVLENQINDALQREKMRLTFGQTRVGNTNVHYIQTPLVAPSWAVADGNLYFGLYPSMVAEAAAHVSGRGASILDNPAFVAARQKLGANAQKVSSFTFIDLPNTAASGYQALLALSQLGTGVADMFGVKTPPMVLPPFNKFKQHLSPAASFSWSDEEGWHYAATSPFPGAELMGSATSPAAFGVALLGAGAAVPAMAQARDRADRVKSASNLRQIGMGCMLYANDHRGKYPANLGPLVLEADLHPDVLLSPRGGVRMPPEIRGKKLDEQAAWAAANSDYVYLGANLNPNMGAEKVLAYEKPEINQNQGMNVLFNDGHVEWMPVERAMQMIRAQQQAPK